MFKRAKKENMLVYDTDKYMICNEDLHMNLQRKKINIWKYNFLYIELQKYIAPEEICILYETCKLCKSFKTKNILLNYKYLRQSTVDTTEWCLNSINPCNKKVKRENILKNIGFNQNFTLVKNVVNRICKITDMNLLCNSMIISGNLNIIKWIEKSLKLIGILFHINRMR